MQVISFKASFYFVCLYFVCPIFNCSNTTYAFNFTGGIGSCTGAA